MLYLKTHNVQAASPYKDAAHRQGITGWLAVRFPSLPVMWPERNRVFHQGLHMKTQLSYDFSLSLEKNTFKREIKQNGCLSATRLLPRSPCDASGKKEFFTQVYTRKQPSHGFSLHKDYTSIRESVQVYMYSAASLSPSLPRWPAGKKGSFSPSFAFHLPCARLSIKVFRANKSGAQELNSHVSFLI